MRQGHSIQLKFILVFVGVLLVSCISSLLLASGFMRSSIIRDMKSQLVTTAESIARMSKSTDMDIEEVLDAAANPFYSITVYDPQIDSLPAALKQEDLSALIPGQVLIITHDETQVPVAVLKLDNEYIMVTSHTDRNELVNFQNSALTALLFCAVIGAMLMLVAITQITKPVKRLTRAAKEIGKGNFDISIDYDSPDEIGQLTQSFNAMAKELQSMEYLRKDFISSVSHEFKTPIASIQGFARLLKTKDLTKEEFEEYTDVIISESARLSRLSSNMLRLSRLENQTIPDVSTEFSLDEQIRNTLLLLENEWSAKNLELDLEMESVKYTGDEEMLQQVWINLISNAIKFSPEGGLLKIRLSRGDVDIRAEITDYGSGIPTKAQPRIFEKFYQGDPSRAKEGNGLGLSIVKQILDRCDASISFESEEGKGTTFVVVLPQQRRGA